MSEQLILRPGMIGGFYPERDDERLGLLDRAMARLYGWVGRVLAARQSFGLGFRWRVHRAGLRLRTMDQGELAAERARIVERLAREGLDDGAVASGFALVREMSGRTLGMRHFGVQILGGRCLLAGEIAEMDTGEGKTLTATLAASLMALSGVPVHVLTVNDFLAARDAEWMGPLYRALGLSVGAVQENSTLEERKRAYACDITYATNKQITFDYLKDRLAMNGESRPLHMALDGLRPGASRRDQIMMRGLCYAIVDEADSVLVDEARTPLIITRPGDASAAEETYRRAIEIARSLKTPRDFTVDARAWKVTLTDLGRAQLARITRHYGGVWAVESHREALMGQALAALFLYQRDRHYLVEEERVQIVDEYTGRVMADRSWERGLHQMIEVKEGVDISSRQETLIRISYQRFFRRYLRLSGMTGTAREVAAELQSVYGLRTRRIPTNRRSRRRDLGQICYGSEARKWAAVVRRIERMHAKGRPVLVGTQSVAESEHLAELLDARGLRHRVLNARQNKEEADIVARAGEAGRITVATNMAGRGTDIAIDENVRARGGLHVISTCRHDSRRIDRQLYGRCGRQGDPGSHLTILSLEDPLIATVFRNRLRWMVRACEVTGGWVPGPLARAIFRFAQRSSERRNGRMRRQLLRADDSLEDLLAFSGQMS